MERKEGGDIEGESTLTLRASAVQHTCSVLIVESKDEGEIEKTDLIKGQSDLLVTSSSVSHIKMITETRCCSHSRGPQTRAVAGLELSVNRNGARGNGAMFGDIMSIYEMNNLDRPGELVCFDSSVRSKRKSLAVKTSGKINERCL
ncbi:hypothetical protein F2P81_008237 [Scophthalmus maximus]|uniref:Uncharacterized protein n=1 Tax=Scophthalmus maximus TaxID=52904 RepID=A0A6A4TCS7_SCOMX|nr:hypothetical protein F2P81_008237 [Scophthalmus maximus]